MNKAKAAVSRKGAAAKPVKNGPGKSSKTPPIELYYWPTPNGHKISILLEELKLPYVMKPVNIGAGEQFTPAFLKISPNNRMPAIIDPRGPGGKPVSVFESGAILQYLGRKTGKFYPKDERQRVAVEEWLFWQVGGLGPMAGQANHFLNYSKEDLTYPKQRYTDEVHRLFGVMDKRLTARKFLAGAYSIADMACLSWVKSSTRFQPLDDFPNLAAWMERLLKRPAVQRGLNLGAELRKPITDEQHKVLFGQRAR
jgi:GSH-dependent disulfide-bond oxidoreductase